MEKRKIIFGTYDTALHGWTLTGWELEAPEQKTQYVEKPNGDGSWDLSTALSDGVMRYKDRELTATFECSEGTRRDREATIREMINALDGMKLEIRLPDDDTHYLVGRLHVRREYSDLYHAAVSVEAICEPWKYADSETVVNVTLTAAGQHVTLRNAGRRAVAPVIKVTGSALLRYSGKEQTLAAGEHIWADLILTPGAHAVECSGSGTVTLTYREAVLD